MAFSVAKASDSQYRFYLFESNFWIMSTHLFPIFGHAIFAEKICGFPKLISCPHIFSVMVFSVAKLSDFEHHVQIFVPNFWVISTYLCAIFGHGIFADKICRFPKLILCPQICTQLLDILFSGAEPLDSRHYVHIFVPDFWT